MRFKIFQIGWMVVCVKILFSAPVYLDMDIQPEYLGWETHPDLGGTAEIDSGILTIKSYSYQEFKAPSDWIENVNNRNGWIIEAKVQLIQGQLDNFLWIHDNTNLTILSLYPDSLVINYPEHHLVRFMNTTEMFHTFRLVGRNNKILFYIDNNPCYIYKVNDSGGGSMCFYFGDGGGSSSISRWDYVMYDTDPEPLYDPVLIASQMPPYMYFRGEDLSIKLNLVQLWPRAGNVIVRTEAFFPNGVRIPELKQGQDSTWLMNSHPIIFDNTVDKEAVYKYRISSREPFGTYRYKASLVNVQSNTVQYSELPINCEQEFGVEISTNKTNVNVNESFTLSAKVTNRTNKSLKATFCTTLIDSLNQNITYLSYHDTLNFEPNETKHFESKCWITPDIIQKYGPNKDWQIAAIVRYVPFGTFKDTVLIHIGS